MSDGVHGNGTTLLESMSCGLEMMEEGPQRPHQGCRVGVEVEEGGDGVVRGRDGE